MVNVDKVRIVRHYVRCAADALTRAADNLDSFDEFEQQSSYVADQLERAVEDAAMAQHEVQRFIDVQTSGKVV